MKAKSTNFLVMVLVAMVGLVAAVPVMAKDKLPQTTADGLELVRETAAGAVYARPGASLESYSRVMLVDAYVAFKKDWQKNYNRSRVGLGEDIRDDDIQRIKSDVASEFKRVFSEELEKGGYEVTEESGADVLILRPAIINLDVTAPDTNKPGMRAVIVSSAGVLTLYVELYDSVSSEKLAEVFDTQEAGARNFGYRATKVTNRQALDQVLREWSGKLVKRLDEAHGKSE